MSDSYELIIRKDVPCNEGHPERLELRIKIENDRLEIQKDDYWFKEHKDTDLVLGFCSEVYALRKKESKADE